MREDIPGRANVADTPELAAYYEELAAREMGALWTVANDIEPWFPKPKSVPVIWRWQDVRPFVDRAPGLVRPEDAGRRVVMLVNPGRRDISAAVGLLYTGVQVMDPGECASAHRHMASALRFIMEGSGAYTIVEGERMTLGARDFVLTPNGTWHEHGVAEGGTRSIWQDGLDIPLMNALDANFYAVHPDLHQGETKPVDGSAALWSGGIIQPTELRKNWQKPWSPVLKYAFEPAFEALTRAAKIHEGSPFDGVIMEYVNPLTGGPVMPTIGASLQLLRPGQHTRAHRHTGSIVYQVARGSGFSIIDGKRYDWSEKDIFVVPSWSLHEHANASESEEACLFSFNDLPVMRALGIYHEEAYTGTPDGRQAIIAG
ncbi:cupin domain-containing protein [uncultured Tistrella sp.]|uniref:cupin domain-containing protein n=1 Tax=Tistrella mobilis TaxID=171437 RepID=UPI0026027631|nr:cupin domain-containing protein [uncultured Tistrella sp.]